MSLLDSLRKIRAESNLSEREWQDLVALVLERANAPVPGPTAKLSAAQIEAHNDSFTWELPKTSAWLTTAELARVLGISTDLCAKWGKRGKLPKPDEYVNGRACWSRSTVRWFCQGLVELANGSGR